MIGACGRRTKNVDRTNKISHIDNACYESQSLGLRIDYDKSYDTLLKFTEENGSYSDFFSANEKSLQIDVNLDDRTYPVATIYSYDRSISEEELEEINPMMVHMGMSDERTYTILYAEYGENINDKEVREEYYDLMNNFCLNIKDHFTLLGEDNSTNVK